MKKLVRSEKKVFGGVCAGVAEFFGWDAGVLRVVWAILAILGTGSPVLFYFILWFLMPDAAKSPMSYEERMNKRLGK